MNRVSYESFGSVSLLLILLCLSSYHSVSFHDLTYHEMNARVYALNSSVAMIASTKELYGLPEVTEGNIKCSPLIIRITDKESLSNDFLRPQVIISGAIHGNERVGPQTSVFMAELLVWSALCEIEKSISHCQLLEGDGVSKDERIWLAYLSSRRDTYIIPAANCIGYIKDKREDAQGVDPNRDFPYSRKDNNCLRSNTAKLFYKMMTTSLIQLVVTFHGGMVAIGFEWGSINHRSPKDKSPDDTANSEIGSQMVSYAGMLAYKYLLIR
jgi:hypothetical protein